MDFYTVEKSLFLSYSIIIGFSCVACITSAIAWTHWKYVLDACPETNCGCFLYGQSTRSSYQGGHIAYCHYATYGLLIPIVFAVVFACYHGYRVCMGTGQRKKGVTTVRQREGDVIVVTAQSDLVYSYDISILYWVIVSIISCLMVLYTLIYASIYTDGYNHSCFEARNEVIKYLSAAGNVIGVIKDRLSCASIFDFIDYLHEDTATYRVRTYRINSALCYHFALITSWISVFVWILILFLNIFSFKKSKQTDV